MLQSKPGRQQLVSRFIYGWCATWKTMRVWGKNITAACPRCNVIIEDTNHILLYKSQGAINECSYYAVKLKEWMYSNTSCPDIL